MSRDYSLAEIRDLVRRTAPVLYLHDDEPYLPSSVQWYLERATLVSKDGKRTPLAGNGKLPEDNLPQHQEQWPALEEIAADYWLEVPDPVLAGDYTTARSYVSIHRRVSGFLDIFHWFWYPGNGCGRARVKALAFDTTVATEEAIDLATLGFHISDWEKVTVRVTDDAENRIDSVYFSQHAGGEWVKPEQLDREANGAFAVYASRNGHASYPHTGPNYTYHIKTAPPQPWAKLTPAALEIWLRNDAMKGKRKVDCSVSHEIVAIESSIALRADPSDVQSDFYGVPYFGRVTRVPGQSPVLSEPPWLQYPYRWGPETEQKITHETVFEALKMAMAPLAIYGVLTVGAALPILGAIAGLLVPHFVKMNNQCGKQGPKAKYTWNQPDEASPPEPENYFEEAVGPGVSAMVDWVEAAGRDVANWVAGATGSVASWTEGAVGDVANWTQGAAFDTASWFSGAGKDVVDFSADAAKDGCSWAVTAAGDVADWVEGAAEDTARALDPRNW